MKKLLTSIILLFTVYPAFCQTDTTGARKNLAAIAEKMVQSFAARDYETFTNFVYPEIITIAGGRENLIAQTRAALKQMEDDGVTITNATVERPGRIISFQNKLQSVIRENLTLKVEHGHYLGKSYLIAISNDRGKTWYFIDTSNKSIEKMREILPFLSKQLVIPAREKPVFVED